MSLVCRFPSFLDFQVFLWELEDAHLRKTLWAKDERGDWYVWVPEDAVVGEDSVSGSIAEEKETAELTRNSIMQQAAISILAQANAQPQAALSLLQ